MTDENKHMDDSFKKMSDEFKVTYDKSFWDSAKAQLENESLDNAFREAAANYVPLFGAGLASESLGDAFMDDAFREAAKQTSVIYDQAYWQQMAAVESQLYMDDAFFDASKGAIFNYNPAYWGDANTALEAEGLHHEYQSSYWNEAKDLLDKADRKTFFTKWRATAALLVLISFFGIYAELGSSSNFAKVDQLKSGLSEKTTSITTTNQLADSVLPDGIENNDAGTLAEIDENEVIHNAQVQNTVNAADGSAVGNEELENLIANHIDLENQSRQENQIENQEIQGQQAVSAGEFEKQAPVVQVKVEDKIQQDVQGANNLNDATDGDLTSAAAVDVVAPIVSVFNNGNNRFANGQPEQVKKNVQNRFDMELMPLRKRSIGLLAMPQTSLMEITPLKRHPAHIISLIGGAGFGNNFGLDDLLLTRRIYGGFEYLIQNQGKLRNFEIGLGLGVNYSKHDGFGVDTLVQHFLDNGEVERYWYKLQVHDLFYANANLLINFRLNPKNKVKFGLGIEKLIGAQSNMAFRNVPEYDVKLNEIVDRGIQTENNNWGVQDGLKQIDMRFSLGYEYRLTRKFGVQLNTSIGLFDRSDDEFYGYGSNIFDHEMSVTLGLKYNLFTRVK